MCSCSSRRLGQPTASVATAGRSSSPWGHLLPWLTPNSMSGEHVCAAEDFPSVALLTFEAGKLSVERGCAVRGRTFAASLHLPTRWQLKTSPGIAKSPLGATLPPRLRTTELNTKHQTYLGCLRLGQGLGLQHLYQKAGAYNCPQHSI